MVGCAQLDWHSDFWWSWYVTVTTTKQAFSTLLCRGGVPLAQLGERLIQ